MFHVIISITWAVFMLMNPYFSFVSNIPFRKISENFLFENLNIYQRLNLELGNKGWYLGPICVQPVYKISSRVRGISVCRVGWFSVIYDPRPSDFQHLSSVLSLACVEPPGAEWEWQTNKKQ